MLADAIATRRAFSQERKQYMSSNRLPYLTLCWLLVFALATVAFPATAQSPAYPDRTIKIVVPYAAGGAVDIVARIVGQALAEQLKQPVIVDNRPGASAKHRHGIGRQERARRLHAADGFQRAHDQHGAVSHIDFRRPQGFRAHRAHRLCAAGDRRTDRIPGQIAEGSDRDGQGQAGRPELWQAPATAVPGISPASC